MTNIMMPSCDLLKHYPHVQAASVTIKAATNDNANDNTEENAEKTLNYYYCPKSQKNPKTQKAPSFPDIDQDGSQMGTAKESKTDDSNKPALLFLHGILGDGRTFLPLLDQFPEFDVYALTQSGFGSPPNNLQEDNLQQDEAALFDTSRHADELIAFCEAINRPFIVIAWSYACHVTFLALEKAITEINQQSETAHLFHSAICYELIVPSYGMSNEDQVLFTRDITKMMSPIIKAYRRDRAETAVDAFIAACKNSDSPYTREHQSPSIQKIKQDNAHTLPKLLSQVEPKDLSAESLAKIHQRIPITILCGENSRAIFQLSSKAGAQALSQNAWIIKDADHLLPENDPLRFASEIKKRLD